MSVWLCIPSARPPEEADKVLSKWRAQGYRIALFLDSHPRNLLELYPGLGACQCPQLLGLPSYPGYARAVNSLIAGILQIDAHAEWFVTGGDDTEPDLNHTAEEIAEQCNHHFSYQLMERTGTPHDIARSMPDSTFGVMQPTGDRYANGSIDRIAGSAWYGREYCKRVNGGRGPLWPEYHHMFVDQEAQCVAQKLGAFWQRPDLIHLHHHFMRESNDLNSPAIASLTPPHLIEANTPEHWYKYQTLFNVREAAGFPGHEPLPLESMVTA